MKSLKTASLATAMLAVAATGWPAAVSAQEPGAFARAAYTAPLADVCPNPFIIQKDWLAQANHGYLYQMIGAGGAMESGRYAGPLGATGIDLVILGGGGGMGLGQGETAYSALYAGNSRAGLVPHLGFHELDNAFIFSKRFPLVGVLAAVDVSPQGLFWDAATYPEGFRSIDDLKAFAAAGLGKIYVSTIQRTWGRFLVMSGVPAETFLEGSRGDGEVFVVNNGTWLNQGFITNEPYSFATGNNWGKPIDFVTVGELGYPNYTGMLSVATGRMDELAPCLERLVPVMQQAIVDYMEDPAEVLGLIHAFNEAGHAAPWWRTPMPNLDYAWRTMKERGIMGPNGTTPVGAIDMTRVTRMLEIVGPWLDERAEPDVKPEDIATNRFINPNIGVE